VARDSWGKKDCQKSEKRLTAMFIILSTLIMLLGYFFEGHKRWQKKQGILFPTNLKAGAGQRNNGVKL
jgi:hypothetical protein